MIFSIDHIVFAASPRQSLEITDRLDCAGFRPEAFSLDFPEIGAASESLSFKGGGFVEFVVELDSTRSPQVWFNEVPRVVGLGFSSDDFEADTWWSSEPEGWVMDEDHALPGGSRLNIHAAGPHEHLSDFFVFVMDRPDGRLQFPERSSGPRLRQLTFQGAQADQWKSRLEEWLRLPVRSDILTVGDVELRFLPGAHPAVRVSPTFEVTSGGGDAPLATGRVELVVAQ